MKAIYAPRGLAREYSPLTANLYLGCSGGCRYCYVPKVQHITRMSFHRNPRLREGVLEQLEKDAEKANKEKRILLCFTSDPYQGVDDNEHTRHALEILGKAGCKVSVLTKNGMSALRDVDLFKRYDIHFGTTIAFSKEASRKEWEPGASPLCERLAALRQFGKAGVPTWVSLEPVIYRDQALKVIRLLLPYVDMWQIGKINYVHGYDDQPWGDFVGRVKALLEIAGANYRFKSSLMPYLRQGKALTELKDAAMRREAEASAALVTVCENGRKKKGE